MAAATPSSPGTVPADQHWVGTWAVGPQTQEATLDGPAPAPPTFSNQTLRQIIHTSIGGEQVRVRLSNQFGTDPLVIGTASIGLSAGGVQVAPGSVCALTFSGSPSITIAPGALVVSDAILLDVPALSDLAINIYLPSDTAGTTLHVTGGQTNYVLDGDQTLAPAPGGGSTMPAYFFVKNVEVLASKSVGAIVCLGDSITDGYGSTPGTNQRWPNFLAERLLNKPNAAYHHGVLNQGISGNRLLHKGTGPDLLSRFDPDVAAQAGATRLILLAGINDIGLGGYLPAQTVSADNIIAAYRQIIIRAHDAGLTVYGGTLTPFSGVPAPYYTDAGEAMRNAVNQFIRTSGEFDGVIDFEAAVRDTSSPPRLLPQYDSGDHLHPNDAGDEAMATAIKLKFFKNAD